MSAEPQPSGVEVSPKRKKIWGIVLGAILAGMVAWALFLLFRPERSAADLLRLLPPGAEFYVVADIEALQFNPAVKKFLADPPSFARDEDYEQFVKGTSFRYQQDLQQVAVAKVGLDWLGAARVRLDRARVIQHLESQGGEKIQEEGLTIYRYGKIRLFHLVLLQDDLVVFTVGSDAEPIRQMVKRFRGQLADSGAAELEQAKASGHLSEGGELQVLGRMDRWLSSSNPDPRWRMLELAKAFLKGSKRLYGSVNSGLTALDFQVETECDSPADAERIAQTSQVLLKLVEAMPQSGSPAMDQKLPALLAGISVRPDQGSVFFEWRWDRETLSRLEQNSQ
ncbi:MAG: hypothetical protein HY648_03005 [Acidobacteria bacterium]|nr:hypothetical protein [Acidobacteriota bacterium]